MPAKSLILALLLMCSTTQAMTQNRGEQERAEQDWSDTLASDAAKLEEPAPHISWQLLRQYELKNEKNSLAISGTNSAPFYNDSPFTDKRIVLPSTHSISVLLPANHWFYLEFADFNDNTSNDAPFSHHQTFSLQALISSAPGLARKLTWQQKQQLLPPSQHNRVLQISNSQNTDIHFFMAQGGKIQDQTFAPLSWMESKSVKQDSRQKQRFNNAKQYQDYLATNVPLEFELKKDKIYWQEAVQLVTHVWGQRQHQLWTWEGRPFVNKKSSLVKAPLQSQILFASSSRKQLLRHSDSKSSALVRTVQPGVFKANHDLHKNLRVDREGFVRLQASDEDWLFSKNYQTYGAPGIEARLKQARFSHQLQQQISSRASVKKRNQIVSDSSTLSVLNKWLSWANLKPVITPSTANNQSANNQSATNKQHALKPSTSIKKHSLNVKNISVKSLNWDFTGLIRPDLSQQAVVLGHQPKNHFYNHIKSGQELLFYNSPQNISNQLQLQTGFINTNDLSQLSPTLEVFVDGKLFEEFQYYKPDLFGSWMHDPNWQLDIQDTGTKQLISNDTITLPANWQTIMVRSPNSELHLNLRFRKPNYPKFDEIQWLSWFSDATTHKHSQTHSQNNNEHSGSSLFSSIVSSHPHWLHFKHFIDVKRQQFESNTPPAMWQRLIIKGEKLTGLFDLPMPDGMEEYQRLQIALQNPDVNNWSYWKTLLTELRNAGWTGYANALSNTLIRYHSDGNIIKEATLDYLSQLQQAQNGSLQVSLLSYLYLTPHISDKFRHQVALSLASVLKKQRRFDIALFILSTTTPDVSRDTLIAEIARQQGFRDLTTAFEPSEKALFAKAEGVTERLTDRLLLDESAESTTHQLSYGAVKSIASKKSLQLYNADLKIFQSNHVATPEHPLRLQVSKGAEVDIEARIWFDVEMEDEYEKEKEQTKAIANDWLQVAFNDKQSFLPLYVNNYRSEGLVHSQGSVGEAHRYRITMPEHGTLKLTPTNHSISVHIKEVSTNLSSNYSEQPCYRDNTLLVEKDGTLVGNKSFWQTNLPVRWSRFPQSEKEQNESEKPFNCAFSHVISGKFSDFKVTNADVHVQTQHSELMREPDYNEFIAQLHKFETQPDNVALTELNQTLENWPDSATKFRLKRRLNANTQWQVQANPIRAKKFTFFEANTNTPLTPSGYRARLMHTPFRPDWERLSEKTSLNYSLAVTEHQEHRLKLHSQNHLFQQHTYAEVEISVNAKVTDIVPIEMGQEMDVPLYVPPGTQNLTVRLLNREGQVSVLTQLQFREKNQTDAQNKWQEQPQSVRLKLFQADKKQPFQQFFSEPVWLRIDSFTGHGISKQQFIAAEKGMFSWYPDEPTDLGHRIYKLTLKPVDAESLALAQTKAGPKKSKQTRHPKDTISTPDIEFPTFQYLPRTPDYAKLDFIDRPWGLSLSKQQRRSPTEDSAQNNRFMEVMVHSQDSDELRRYFSRYQLAARNYDSDLSQSVHANYQWWDRHFGQNIQLSTSLSIAAQNGYQNEGLAWSSQAEVELQWQNSLNRRLFNRISVRLWGNLIESGKDTQQFATSVYSQYKLDHRYGVEVTENISYKWHHDLVSWAKFSLNSNPLSDKNLLDNGKIELGARMFYQGLSTDIRWRYQTFLTDKDRLTKSHDSRISAAIEWFDWREDSHFRLRVNYDRNLTTNENYWGISISYNDSGARGVQDYAPQSLTFSDLRQQQFINQRLRATPGH